MKNSRSHRTFPLFRLPHKTYRILLYLLFYILFISYNQVSQTYSLFSLHIYHSLADINLSSEILLTQHSSSLTHKIWNALSEPASQLVTTWFSRSKLRKIRSKPMAEWQANPKGKKLPLKVWHETRQLPWRVSRKIFPDHVPTFTAPRKP